MYACLQRGSVYRAERRTEPVGRSKPVGRSLPGAERRGPSLSAVPSLEPSAGPSLSALPSQAPSAGPSLSAVPSTGPTQSAVPSQLAVPSTGPSQSAVPSQAPSTLVCFTSGGELYHAVRAYVQGRVGDYAQYGLVIGSWCVSEVTNFSLLFYDSYQAGALDNFNEPLTNWDTSKATNMSNMFNGAASFNQDLSHFDSSNVVEMFGMFFGAAAFNQDISGWDVSSVTAALACFGPLTPLTRICAIGEPARWAFRRRSQRSGCLTCFSTRIVIAARTAALPIRS
jgi:surface protein